MSDAPALANDTSKGSCQDTLKTTCSNPQIEDLQAHPQLQLIVSQAKHLAQKIMASMGSKGVVIDAAAMLRVAQETLQQIMQHSKSELVSTVTEVSATPDSLSRRGLKCHLIL